VARLLRARAHETRGDHARAARGYRDVLEILADLPLSWIRPTAGLSRGRAPSCSSGAP
jgi:hypothetical protein